VGEKTNSSGEITYVVVREITYSSGGNNIKKWRK
jgi:hypothetical protein